MDRSHSLFFPFYYTLLSVFVLPAAELHYTSLFSLCLYRSISACLFLLEAPVSQASEQRQMKHPVYQQCWRELIIIQ